MPRYRNPYGPQTPIGAGLSSLSKAIFASRVGDRNQRDYAALDAAHAGLYEEQARKAAVERQLAERLLANNSDDSVDFLRATEAGMPVHTVRGIDAALTGQADIGDYDQEMLARHRRATLGVRPAFADKSVSSVDIAKALDSLRMVDDRNAVRGAPGDPTRTSQAYFSVSGKAPFDFTRQGTGNLATGAFEMSDLGNADVEAEEALARQRRATAQQTELENRLGVKVGAPVIASSGDPSQTSAPRFVSPIDAVQRGLEPGARPVAPKPLAGPVVTTTEEPIAPLRITPKDSQMLLDAVREVTGGQLGDSNIESIVLSRAQEYYRTPGSPAFGLPDVAAQEAVKDVLPKGVHNPLFDFSGIIPKDGHVPPASPVRIVGPTTKTRKVTRTPMDAAAPATAAAPARPQAAQVPGRPAGKSDQQLIDEANDAVRRGADRNAVMQRLQAWGVPIT